jgi:Nucleotide modification associated domain 2
MLISGEFIYWGGSGPRIPRELRAFGPKREDICCKSQGDKCRFSDAMGSAAVRWIEGFDKRGIQGRPGQWPLA